MLEDMTHLIGEQPCGVYLLLQDHDVVYVGQTTNLPVRINQHCRSEMKFNRVLVHWCEYKHIDKLECDYINKYKPKYNIRSLHTSGIRNLSLRPRRRD